MPFPGIGMNSIAHPGPARALWRRVHNNITIVIGADRIGVVRFIRVASRQQSRVRIGCRLFPPTFGQLAGEQASQVSPIIKSTAIYFTIISVQGWYGNF